MTAKRTVLAANVAPGMKVRRGARSPVWLTVSAVSPRDEWPPRLDITTHQCGFNTGALTALPGDRLARHPECTVADNTAPIGPFFAVQGGEYPHDTDSPHAPMPPVPVLLCGWVQPPTPAPRAAPRYEVFYTTASIFSLLTEHRSPDIGKALREMQSLTPMGTPQALKTVRSVYRPGRDAALTPGRYILWLEQPAYAAHWGYTGPYPQIIVVQPRVDTHLTTLVKTHPDKGEGGRHPIMVPVGPGSARALVTAIEDATRTPVYDLARLDPPTREG